MTERWLHSRAQRRPTATEARVAVEELSVRWKCTPIDLACVPRNECVVCLSGEATFASVPCGHKILCEVCSTDMLAPNAAKVCPMCSAQLTQPFYMKVW